MTDFLTAADFSPFLHQIFNIRFSTQVTLPAELIEVTEMVRSMPEGRTPFSVVFRTEQTTEYYPQATFGLQHPEKGEIPVFLVPLGLDKEKTGMRYEAIFN